MATSYHVDPIANPSSGTLVTTNTSGGVEAICDLNPSGSKDLVRVVKHRGWPSDSWYLQVSTDNGASWSYLTASSGTPPEIDTDSGYRCLRICQDTSSYAIHVISAATLATVTQYQRITLGYTANHVTSWSWAASDITGPGYANYNGWGGGANIYEVVDGNSVHRLLVVLNEYVSATRIKQLVAAVTTPSAGLAPTGASDWCKITDYTATSARDILGDYNTDTNTESLSAKHYTSQSSENSARAGDCGTFQLSNGDLHVFTGPAYNNGQPIDTGAISRWRYTASGSDWVADTNVVGVDIAPVSGTYYASPCIGGTRTNSGKSIGYISYWRHDGLHIDSVNTSGTWTQDALPQPDNGSGPGDYTPIASNWVWGWSAIGCDSNGTLYVSYDRSYGFNGHALNSLQQEGYYDGSQWQLTDTTSQWATADGWGATTDGATTWASIAGIDGVGVIAYPYAQVYSDPYFSSHVLLADAAAPGAELEGSSTSTTSGTGALTTSITMAGSSASTTSGTAALATSILMLGASASSTMGTGALSTQVQMSGASSSSTLGTGALSTGIVLGGSAQSVSTNTGSLSTGIVLAAQSQSICSGIGDLDAAIVMAATCLSDSLGTGALTTEILLSGTATSVALGQGAISTGASGAMDASGTSVSVGTGALTTEILLSSAAWSVGSGTGALSTGIALAGNAQSISSGDAVLYASIRLAATSLAECFGAGVLSTDIVLSANGLSETLGQANLTSTEPPAPGRRILFETRPTAICHRIPAANAITGPIGNVDVVGVMVPVAVTHGIGANRVILPRI